MQPNKNLLGNRRWGKILSAPFQPIHYRALVGIFAEYPNPIENFKRYLFNSGEYPYQIRVRTPIGEVQSTLSNPFDIRTVNEIFCRLDYPAHTKIKTVVDIGSNIGISALYFLTRNTQVKCYLFEPNPENIAKLGVNLQDFSGRYFLSEKAVDAQEGQLKFAIESTGRYGGLVVDNISRENCNREITVDCENVNHVLQRIVDQESSIDILKIDTEGTEARIIKAIHHDLLFKIKAIYFEMNGRNFLDVKNEIFPTAELAVKFSHRKYGDTYQLTRLD
jgi:FkbM family methyltransferase